MRDAVSTPRSHLTDAALGLSEAAPRALPQDFFVAVTSAVIDGGIVVKVLLVAGLWLAGWGAARLASAVLECGLPGQFLAATLAIWNPYVTERLLQGHWSLLVGYGCLPWVAVCVLRLRAVGGPMWGLLFWIALAGLTPTGLMLAATVALPGQPGRFGRHLERRGGTRLAHNTFRAGRHGGTARHRGVRPAAGAA
ncbi:membrane protein [Mycolicibacterium conceptionense]|uniref:Membrane protein n=1 Tax=Mycolicibacterium conceptionense TaxID=451644 RepID=A0A0U1DEZ1_9MYCO|nr:membrane protein [Mycolicibacterium conceptionense]